MKKELGWALAIGVVAIVVYALVSNQHTVPVLTKQFGVENEYYLYVPNDNGKSTCTWSYNDENGKPSTFTTYPDTQLYKTGEHDLIYSNQTQHYSNVSVECLSSEGTKYMGVFQH